VAKKKNFSVQVKSADFPAVVTQRAVLAVAYYVNGLNVWLPARRWLPTPVFVRRRSLLCGSNTQVEPCVGCAVSSAQ
jgi:hypothetical protein